MPAWLEARRGPKRCGRLRKDGSTATLCQHWSFNEISFVCAGKSFLDEGLLYNRAQLFSRLKMYGMRDDAAVGMVT